MDRVIQFFPHTFASFDKKSLLYRHWAIALNGLRRMGRLNGHVDLWQ